MKEVKRAIKAMEAVISASSMTVVSGDGRISGRKRVDSASHLYRLIKALAKNMRRAKNERKKIATTYNHKACTKKTLYLHYS